MVLVLVLVLVRGFVGEEPGPGANHHPNNIPLACQAGDLDAARGLLETRMPQDGVSPSGITVCALLNAFCRAGKVDEALALFDALPQRGLPRDARVYAAVMQALLAQGRGEEVQVYLERMAQEGVKCVACVHALGDG